MNSVATVEPCIHFHLVELVVAVWLVALIEFVVVAVGQAKVGGKRPSANPHVAGLTRLGRDHQRIGIEPAAVAIANRQPDVRPHHFVGCSAALL